MALNRDFRVKDSLNTGISGLFRAGQATAYPNTNAGIAIDTYGKILSGGRDLVDIFQNTALAKLSNGAGVNTFTYDGDSAATVSISGASTLNNDRVVAWSTSTGFVDGSISNTQLNSLFTNVTANSASWSAGGTADSTVKAFSAQWTSAYNGLTALSGNWQSTYTSYYNNSGSFVEAVAPGASQGTVVYTNLSGGTTTFTVTELGTTGNPTVNSIYIGSASPGRVYQPSSNIIGFSGTGAVATGYLSANTIVYANGGSSPGWNQAYTAVNAGSATWNQAYTEVSTSSAGWDQAYTSVNTGSATWNQAYTGFNTTSGANVKAVTAGTGQGTLVYTNLSGGTTTITLPQLSSGGSPTFTTLSATGNATVNGTATINGGLTAQNLVSTSSISANTIIYANGGNSNTWNSGGQAYTAFNSASGTLVTAVANTATQGRFSYTNLSGGTTNVDLTNLGTGGSPTFTGLTATGDVYTKGQTVIGDASGDLLIVNASSNFNNNLSAAGATTYIRSTEIVLGDANTDTVTINSGPVNFPSATSTADALVIGGDVTLYRSAADILATDDSLSVTGGLTANGDIVLGDASTDTLTIDATTRFVNATTDANAIQIGADVKLYAGSANTLVLPDNLIVTGNQTIYGDLSVAGTTTTLDTVVSVTSALSVQNSGTGPALYVSQTGVQPIAYFADREGGAIVFADTGEVSIGASSPFFDPAEKLTVAGNISASGTIKLGGLTNNTTSVSALVMGANNTVQGRILPQVALDTTNRFISAASGALIPNYIPLNSDAYGLTTSQLQDLGGNSLLSEYIGGISFDDGSGPTATVYPGVVEIVTSINSSGYGLKLVDNANPTSVIGKGTRTVPLTSGFNRVATYPKANLASSKYYVTLKTGALRTAFDINAVNNGTTGFGTVYGIVDAQATSLLTDVDIEIATSTVDLLITVSSACSAVIDSTAIFSP